LSFAPSFTNSELNACLVNLVEQIVYDHRGTKSTVLLFLNLQIITALVARNTAPFLLFERPTKFQSSDMHGSAGFPCLMAGTAKKNDLGRCRRQMTIENAVSFKHQPGRCRTSI
jgi:hypothetical protein